MRKVITSSAAVALALLVGLTVAHASGPVSVYSLIDKVSFEPGADKAKPERIRIEGVFIVATGNDSYAEPQRGYLYLSLPPGAEEVARREWTDLMSIAGTRQVVGFGSSWNSAALLKVGKQGAEAKVPTNYPVGNGLVKINADQPRAKALLEFKGR